MFRFFYQNFVSTSVKELSYSKHYMKVLYFAWNGYFIIETNAELYFGKKHIYDFRVEILCFLILSILFLRILHSSVIFLKIAPYPCDFSMRL